MSSRSPICAMCSSASCRARPSPTSLTRCYPGHGRPHKPRPPSRADARGAGATLTDNMAVRREIERTSHQPVDYDAKGELLGVVVRKVRGALLKLYHQGINF